MLHVVGFKLCTSVPEDGQGRPKNVACSFGFNKFIVSDGIKQSNAERYDIPSISQHLGNFQS